MNYTKHYNLLMARARTRVLEGYTESHHVIPRCMGGKNGETVDLTPEEHYVAHQLLVKMYPQFPTLAYAAHMMTVTKSGQLRNNKSYGWVRERMAKTFSDNFKKCHKPDWSQAIVESNKRRKGEKKPHSPEHQAKLNARFTPEYRLRVGNAIGREYQITTPTGDVFTIRNLTRFCKENNLNVQIMAHKKKQRGYHAVKING